MLTFGSLFSGCGLMDLGLHRAGLTCRWYCEIDPDARRVLARHWPDVPCHEDVRSVGRHNLAAVDVIAGGFPCQSVSVCGRRAGLADTEKTGLFYEMVRVTDELRPALLLWENVPGLLTSDHGRDFLRVLLALERIGYSGSWTSLDSRFFGVAQRRRRVFGVFARHDFGAECTAEILALRTRRKGNPPPRRPAEPEVAATLRGRSHGAGVNMPGRGGEDDQNLVTAAMDCGRGGADENDAQANRLVVVGALTTGKTPKGHGMAGVNDQAVQAGHLVPYNIVGLGQPCAQVFETRIARSGRGQPSELAHAKRGSEAGATCDSRPMLLAPNHRVRRLMPVECLRLQAAPDDYLDLDPPLSDSAKYRLIGNGVTVPVAEWLGRRILAFHS